ncbi:hypothetical protein MgSA37_03646 [Mucilaginibacter gotjawali]|uniref:Uncharacterized protein n=1 Tax=Mucilaginibacter gotjawali TaxID=1550579 RepID=A0A0X8X5G7_9SPHI|nr:hypothetical protein MgSA37_03646 [Mucilaginibacter gotjawali]
MDTEVYIGGIKSLKVPGFKNEDPGLEKTLLAVKLNGK